MLESGVMATPALQQPAGFQPYVAATYGWNPVDGCSAGVAMTPDSNT